MNISVEELGPTKKNVTVEVPKEEVKKEYDKALGQYRKQARLKGFRPGKAPMSMIKRLFGPQIQEEVSQKMIQASLPDALDKCGGDVISQPSLESSNFTEGEPFTYTIQLEVKPTFEVSGYEGLELTRDKVQVGDEAIEEKLAGLQRAYSTSKSVDEDRPLKQGDLAVIDYTAFTDGQPLEGAANPNYQLEIGKGAFNPVLEQELEGMEKDQEREVSVSFPENHYNQKLAGKEVLFKVKLLDIKEKIIPELTDDFVKDMGQGPETVDELREKIKEDLTKMETERAQQKLEQQVKDKLIELVEFEVPAGLVHQETEAMLDTTQYNLKRSGITMEAMGLSETKLREDYRPEAEKRVKTGLILEWIAKKQEISVNDEDIDDRILEISRDMGQSPETIRNFYTENKMMDSLRERSEMEKTLKYVLDSATIVEVDPSESTDNESSETSQDEEDRI